jgi:hypothetical protein
MKTIEGMVGAKGFEPSTSWSRTKHNYTDSVSLINFFSEF